MMDTHLVGWLAWLFVGAIAGGVVAILRKPMLPISNIAYVVVGVVGAFIGGLLFTVLGGQTLTTFNPASFSVALVGAVVMLGVLLALDDQSIA
jgi:uncharacterized membrane protein YeaQ/YmgE (transglycosylase-associated protein family)